jgi:hypothetical protein
VSGASDATAWQRTLADLDRLAGRRRADGFDVVTVRAADTTPEPPAAGDSDRFGLVYTAPNDVADDFRAAFRAGTFDRYTVHRRELGATQFLVTELSDAANSRVILLAGAFERSAAAALRTAARDAGVMYSHVQLLDWTHLGTFRHDDPTAFFPAGE